jgi:hypothetical protein
MSPGTDPEAEEVAIQNKLSNNRAIQKKIFIINEII